MNKKEIGSKKVSAAYTQTDGVSVWAAEETIFRMYK